MGRLTPGILIGGTASGVGKTTVAAGIMGALRRRGLEVQPFKVGPDYIDPSYHAAVCGRPSRNLDSWMVSPAALKELYVRAAVSADVVVVEGVMGLFDGRTGLDGTGSSAEVARLLGLPVLLVMDVSKMARSAAAMALGYRRFDSQVNVAGVIANNVASPTHLSMVAQSVEASAGLPVVGHLDRRADLRLAERHLGLIPTAERRVGREFFDRLVDLVEKSVDLDRVLRLADSARPVDAASTGLFPEHPSQTLAAIGLAQDEAFCFHYQDNLDLLTAWGARLVPFSPTHDRALPDGVRGLYLGGGFPEEFAEALSANRSMLAAVRAACTEGMPIYAECGGLMYLCECIADFQGRQYPMVGLVPGRASLRDRRLALGYAEVRARRDSILMREGQSARGHEFHWSSVEPALDGRQAAYDVVEGSQPDGGRCGGYQRGNLLASYIHLHFASNPRLAANFVGACALWRAET